MNEWMSEWMGGWPTLAALLYIYILHTLNRYAEWAVQATQDKRLFDCLGCNLHSDILYLWFISLFNVLLVFSKHMQLSPANHQPPFVFQQKYGSDYYLNSEHLSSFVLGSELTAACERMFKSQHSWRSGSDDGKTLDSFVLLNVSLQPLLYFCHLKEVWLEDCVICVLW